MNRFHDICLLSVKFSSYFLIEFLLVKRSMSFFVTHYPQLCRLAEVYPNVQNQHLGAVADDSGEVRYLHKILPGSCKMSADYGKSSIESKWLLC